MANNLSGVASSTYPSDVRPGAGIGVEKIGLSLRIFLDYTGIPAASEPFSSGWVLIQDPTTRVITKVDLDNLLATPKDASVTNAKLANAPPFTLKGNLTSALGQPQDVLFSDLVLPGNAVGDALAGKASNESLNTLSSSVSTQIGNLTTAVAAKATPADINTIVDPVKTRLGVVEAAQKSNRITRQLFSDFSALTLDANSSYEVPNGDSGTHAGIASEVGYAAGQVPNSGIFIPQGSPLVLRRIGGSGLSLLDALKVAPLDPLILDDDRVAKINAAGTILSVSTAAVWAAYLEAKIVEKRYRFTLDGAATPSSKLWWAADAFRNGGEITHVGQTGTLLIGYGKPPVLYASHTKALAPGDWESFRDGRQDAIYLASDTGTIPVNSFFTNTSNVNPISGSLADAFIARLSGAQTDGERTAIRTFIKDLVDPGVYAKFRTAYLLAATDAASGRLDMVRNGSDGGPSGLTLYNNPTFTPKLGYTGDGSTSYFGLNYTPILDTGHIDVNSYSFGAYVNSLTDTVGAFVMGSVNLALGVNRSGPAGTARASSTSTDVVSVVGRGGLFAASRNSADKYRYIYKQTAQDVTRASTSLGTNNYPMLGLCNNGGGGPTAFSKVTPQFMFVAEYLTDAELFAIDTAVAKYLTAIGA